MSRDNDLEDKGLGLRKLTKKKVIKITSVFVVAVLILVSYNQIQLNISAPDPPVPPPESRANAGYEGFYYYAGGMVNTANGNLYLTQKDISIKARGFNIEIIRVFNTQERSNAYSQDWFGYGWTCNYFIHLQEEGRTGNVTLTEGDGSVHEYGYLDGANYTTPAGKHGRLNKNVDATFVLRFLDGSKYNFNTTGVLQNITDKNGNTLKFTYTSGKLTKIEEDLGQAVGESAQYLNISYDGDKISYITDPLGRNITYAYTNSSVLTNVTDTTGNSTLYSYIYDPGETKPLLDDVINRVGGRLNFTYELDTYSSTYRVKNIYNSIWNYTSNSSYNSFRMYGFTYHNVDSGSDFLNDSFYYTNITDAREYITTVYMNNYSNPLNITDPTGNYTTTKWDSDFNKIGYTDAIGNTYTYTYYNYTEVENITKTYGLQKKATDPTGNYTEYGRDLKNSPTEYASLLMNVTNKRGYKTYYTYDSNYNLLNTTDARGNTSYRTYDSYGNMISHKDFRGFTTNYTYDIHGNLLNVTDPGGNVTKHSYDSIGRLKNVTDARGYKTTYEYDDLDRIVKITDALGNSTEYTYDKVGNRVSVKDANGHTTTYTYNYSVGKKEKIIDASGNETLFSYDRNGNLVTLTNARSYSTTYEYDNLNQLTKVTDARGNYTTSTYDTNGNLVTRTNRRGYTTTYEYDALGRKTKETDALGNSTEYTYDEEGNIKTIKDARGYTTTYYYDELNRLIKVEDPLQHNTTYIRDANGNHINRTYANGESYLYCYDALGQMIKMISPSNDYSCNDYDMIGNVINITNTDNKTTKCQYDALGRTICVTDAIGNSTYAEHDAVGNIVNITNANGYKTTFEYDELKRVKKIISSSGNQTQFSYDEVGNLVKRTDANGNITECEYDELNGLVKIIYPDNNNVSFKYDEEGNIIQITNNGGFGEITYYAYDALDRVISVKVDYGPFNKTINYTYDKVGNRKTMADPDGGVLTYNYDPVGRLINITDPWGNITSLQYDNVGRIMRINYPNNIYTNYTYNTEFNVRNIITRNSTGDILLNLSYKYNKCGEITEMIENSENITYYNVSATGKLLNVTYPNGEFYQYGYDGLGNRLNVTKGQNTTNYTYDCDNGLIKAGSTIYSYDNNRNLISKTDGSNTTHYKYDYENRLKEAKLPETNITYGHSANGDLLWRNCSNPGEKYYLYDSYRILMELDENGSTIAYYNYILTPRGDELTMMKRGDTTLYYHTDLKGSTKIMTDSNENIINSYEYDAFGTITFETENVENEFKFDGLRYDDEVMTYTNPFNPGWSYDSSKDWDSDTAIGYNPIFPWLWEYLESRPKHAIDWEEVDKIRGQINDIRGQINDIRDQKNVRSAPDATVPKQSSDGSLHIGNEWCDEGDARAILCGIEPQIEGPPWPWEGEDNFFVIPDENDYIYPYVDCGIADTRKPSNEKHDFFVECEFYICVERETPENLEGFWDDIYRENYWVYGKNPKSIDYDYPPLELKVPVKTSLAPQTEHEFAQFFVTIRTRCTTTVFINGGESYTLSDDEDGPYMGTIWAGDIFPG